ncbi:hypothetical protein [Prescottella agglutinans]|uniref:hypothetical protein n=1 Tax=Prescottella agglutinans TaxID=1644129 RepID=UPI003D96A504
MIVNSVPDPLRKGDVGYLHLSLEDTERPGEYTFVVTDDTHGTVPCPALPAFAGKYSVTSNMASHGDFDPEVRFYHASAKKVWYKRERNDRIDKSFFPKTMGWTEAPQTISVESPDDPAAGKPVSLVPPRPPASPDEVLWRFIRTVSRRLRFDEFRELVDPALPGFAPAKWNGVGAYGKLRAQADRFVARAANPQTSDDAKLPAATVQEALERSYVHDEREDLARPFLGGDRKEIEHHFPLPNVPFVELIWNYWIEEGMLVQTLNHIVARFQNRRYGPGAGPLTRFDLNPLLPMRALIWGFAEGEKDRLSVRRRAAEYEYEYGLALQGLAVPNRSTIVDSRRAFLEGFHSLLNACSVYFRELDDLTVAADAFPLLSSLREVHLVLARGAHNQYADLALTARAEMLTMQILLAQPEMREFLGGPTMIPYEEPWMDRVDTMKSLQGWSDASVTHFFELAASGEQILLSVRHGRWNESTRTREDAANWAMLWRNEIQRYTHAYRTVTGVDLTAGVDATMPSELLARRMSSPRMQA